MYFEHNWNTIVRKHWVLALLYLIKFVLIFVLACILFYIAMKYKEALGQEVVLYIFFPLVFILVNYSFLRLILWMIEYFNYLFVISWDQIFIINSSLILRNDIEVIDSFKIIKLDAFSRGFFANLLLFWKVTIELQTKEERVFHFIPRPYKLLDCLKDQREKVLENRKKKYIVDDYVTEEKKIDKFK